MNLKNVYNNQLYERYNHPQHKVILQEPCSSSGVYNPSCGDRVTVYLKVTDGKITHVGYQASGCVISGGSADLILEAVLGKSPADVMNITKDDVFSIIGMPLGPNRLRCAFITVEALKNICENI